MKWTVQKLLWNWKISFSLRLFLGEVSSFSLLNTFGWIEKYFRATKNPILAQKSILKIMIYLSAIQMWKPYAGENCPLRFQWIFYSAWRWRWSIDRKRATERYRICQMQNYLHVLFEKLITASFFLQHSASPGIVGIIY